MWGPQGDKATFAGTTEYEKYPSDKHQPMPGSSDPTDITAIAVRHDDMVAAFEANERGTERQTVLRVTPPYSGRMRARLHREGNESYEPGADAIHVRPATLLSEPPALPHPDETEDQLRSDPDQTYTTASHRALHERRLEEWREEIVRRFVDTVALDLANKTHTVDLVVIGDP